MIQAVQDAGMASRAAVQAPHLQDKFGTHHSKFFLVQYPTGLRVIITTANMLDGDVNFKTQGVWYQDFPLKVNNSLMSHAGCSHGSQAR